MRSSAARSRTHSTRSMSHTVRAVAVAAISMPCFFPSRVGRSSPPAHHGARGCLFLEGVRVDRVGGITGGTQGNAERGGEVVAVDPLDHPIDHPDRKSTRLN